MDTPTPKRRTSDYDDLLTRQIEVDPSLAKRLWRQWSETIITVAVLGLYILIWLLFRIIGDIEANQGAAEERGYKNRAVSCQVLIVDNDRTWLLTDDCTEPNVMKYYPPEVCNAMRATEADGCGTLFRPTPFDDPLG